MKRRRRIGLESKILYIWRTHSCIVTLAYGIVGQTFKRPPKICYDILLAFLRHCSFVEDTWKLCHGSPTMQSGLGETVLESMTVMPRYYGRVGALPASQLSHLP